MSVLVLAYGGFHYGDPARDVDVAIRTLSSVVLIAMLAYVPSTLLMENVRGVRRAYALIMYVFVIMVLAPALGVMGEYGPAHVAAHIGVWSIPAFLGVLIVKLVWLSLTGSRNGVQVSDQSAARPLGHETNSTAPVQ